MVRKSQADDDEDDTSHGAHCEKKYEFIKKPIFIDVENLILSHWLRPKNARTKVAMDYT